MLAPHSLPGNETRAAILVILTRRGRVLHLRNKGVNSLATLIVPKQLTLICFSQPSIPLPNSISPVLSIPALLTTACRTSSEIGGVSNGGL